MRAKRTDNGFTLVEILVVIGIITILAGLVVAAVGNAKERAKTEATRATINKILVALAEYRQVYYAYPPDQGAYTGSQNLYYSLGIELDTAGGYDPETGKTKAAKFGPALHGGFKKAEISADKYILDSWNNQLTYTNPGLDHSETGGKNNTAFVDIESPGPNSADDPDGSGEDDDVNNWKIEK